MAWQWWDNFDKRLCGKWICPDFRFGTIFLNIKFENAEKGAEVFFSYKTSTFEHEAIYIEYSGDSLYFFHNERKYRNEYILSFDEGTGSLNMKFIDKGEEFGKQFVLTRLSEDDERKYVHTVKPKDMTKVEILREYAEYGGKTAEFHVEYKFDERENLLDLIKKHDLDGLVKGKNDAETVIALMGWFCGLYRHGDLGLPAERTPQALMEYADSHGGRTNCRGLSLILAQIIRAYGIKAFHITCKPYEEPFDDCHVIVCVYCESLKKHIFLDPSFNLYLRNERGEIIGIDELRDILIDGGELVFNDESADNPYIDGYRDYMAKNLIRLERYGTNRFGHDGGGRVILIPEKYMSNEADGFDGGTKKDFITSRDCFWSA